MLMMCTWLYCLKGRAIESKTEFDFFYISGQVVNKVNKVLIKTDTKEVPRMIF